MKPYEEYKLLGAHLMKLSLFIEKSRGSHSVNSNPLLNGEDLSVKGAMIL